MKTVHKENKKQSALIGFKKARSLLDTIISMTQNGEYCIDIMQQNLAVIGLLKSSHEKLMENHLQTCFIKGMETGSAAKRNQMIEEIAAVSKMGNR